MNDYIYQSPIPFSGQKRYWIKDYLNVLDKFSTTAVYLDLFGGSGLLAHNTKVKYPNSKVIYNDYSNFYNRLNKIGITNQLLDEIMNIINNSNTKPCTIIGDNIKQVVIEKIQEYIVKYSSESLDFITLSSYLLFGGNYENNLKDLISKSFWYKGYRAYKKKTIDNTYLSGCEVVRDDFRNIYDIFKHEKELVLIIDPPYLYTDISGYKGNTWYLQDFLELIDIVSKNPFIMFSSEKSECKAFIDWYLLHARDGGYLRNYKTISKSYNLLKTKQNNNRNNDMLFYSTSLIK